MVRNLFLGGLALTGAVTPAAAVNYLQLSFHTPGGQVRYCSGDDLSCVYQVGSDTTITINLDTFELGGWDTIQSKGDWPFAYLYFDDSRFQLAENGIPNEYSARAAFPALDLTHNFTKLLHNVGTYNAGILVDGRYDYVEYDSGVISLLKVQRFESGDVQGSSVKTVYTYYYNILPEPASWAMMIAGFGLVGAAMRRARATMPNMTVTGAG
jgi:hypothetical protein